MDMRDRLAEDIRSVMRESHGPDGPIDLRGDDPHEWMADRLITLGWTRLDEDRLGRALRLVEDAGTIVLLGTDTRTDEDGLPLRNDYSGVDAECAVAIVKAYQEDAP